MNIHNLSSEEKAIQRQNHLCLDFPNSYSVSLGEFPCIHRCRMCPMFSAPVKKKRFITQKIFHRACECLGSRKAQLEISAFGETFQHPDVDGYLKKARKWCPNAQIIVATNGALLDKNRCKKIVDSGIDHLSLSLDAGSAKTHRWLTGVKNYDQICKNLETLVETRNRLKGTHLKISTHIIGIQELSHEFKEFLTRWEPIVDHAYVRTYGNWAGLVDGNGVTPAQTQFIPKERYPCAWLWYATKIEPNGDVSKCFIHVTGDKMPLGNIMKNDFEKIWQGRQINRVRQMHLSNRIETLEHCNNCSVWSLFPMIWEKHNGVWQ